MICVPIRLSYNRGTLYDSLMVTQMCQCCRCALARPLDGRPPGGPGPATVLSTGTQCHSGPGLLGRPSPLCGRWAAQAGALPVADSERPESGGARPRFRNGHRRRQPEGHST